VTGKRSRDDNVDTKHTSLHKPCCAVSNEAREKSPAQSISVRSQLDPRERMVRLEGDAFFMGSDSDECFPTDGEGPVRRVELSPFWIDKTTVTNTLFERFVRETGYVTEAERFGWSFVFWSLIPEQRFHELVVDTVAATPWWCKVPGAAWNMPEGPGSSLAQREDHPVVHVSWNDAKHYCAWSGQRLPTEAEWEFASRGGLVQKLYPWGDDLLPDGLHRCNIWQGDFPHEDTGDDGYAGTCPVEAFPANGYGLYSMTGNTWEWCNDWFSATFHATASRINPQGPPNGDAKVIKGGSFLCHKSYCNRYRVAARSASTPDSTTSHMSFRCALDAS
jgi:formylglycine-generating enzyme required for sulfatase activity